MGDRCLVYGARMNSQRTTIMRGMLDNDVQILGGAVTIDFRSAASMYFLHIRSSWARVQFLRRAVSYLVRL